MNKKTILNYLANLNKFAKEEAREAAKKDMAELSRQGVYVVNLLSLIAHFKYEVEQVFDEKFKTLQGVKKDFLAELEDLENRTNERLDAIKNLKDSLTSGAENE